MKPARPDAKVIAAIGTDGMARIDSFARAVAGQLQLSVHTPALVDRNLSHSPVVAGIEFQAAVVARSLKESGLSSDEAAQKLCSDLKSLGFTHLQKFVADGYRQIPVLA